MPSRGIAAVVVGLNLVAVLVDALVPSPEGPRSSAFATAPDGLAAWSELATRTGVEVRTLRARPADDTLPAAGTVVLLDPESFSSGQAEALRRFAERGGRVVAGGIRPGDWTADLVGDPPPWRDGAGREARAAGIGQVRAVRSAGEGRWGGTGGARPLIRAREGPIALRSEAGEGEVVLLADPSPLQNRLLDQADNAALALELAGAGPLTFVESVHGYGEATGLAALPARLAWALALVLAAGVLLIAARWRRLGPPEDVEAPLFPPRRAYVDALAATLARTRDRTAAVESVRSAARERLARRAAIGDDADAEAWAGAARSAGLTDDEARALQGDGDDDGIAAGRALARLSGGR